MFVRPITLLACGALIAGCATSKFNNEQAKSIRSLNTVSVSKEVTIPQKPEVFGKKTATAGFLGGAIGAAIAANINDEPEEFKQYLATNNINVGEIVRAELVNYLKKTRTVQSIANAESGPTFEITILRYGLGPTMSMAPINKPLKATITLSVKLKNTDGSLLWEGSEYITALSDIGEAHTLDEFYAFPNITEAAFREAAQAVVREMFKGLNKA